MFRADQSSISRLVKMVSSMLKPSSNHRDSKLGSRSVMFTLCGSSFTPSGFLYFSVLFHPVISMIIIHFLGSSKSPPPLRQGGEGGYKHSCKVNLKLLSIYLELVWLSDAISSIRACYRWKLRSDRFPSGNNINPSKSF